MQIPASPRFPSMVSNFNISNASRTLAYSLALFLPAMYALTGETMLAAIAPAESAPVLSPAAGIYAKAQTVAIADSDASATIHYTTDGSTPTPASSVYSGPIAVSSNTTIQAIAISTGGLASSAVSATYGIRAATPYIAPNGGSYTKPQSIAITDRTVGAAIYYTTDGSTPTAASNAYSAPFTLAQNAIVSAVAIAPGYADSNPASVTYSITQPVASPVFSLASGQYTSAQSVAIADATPGAAIYYTTNGSAPTASSVPYTGPIAVGATETIQAVAYLGGGSYSAATSATYTILLPAAAPVIAPASGTYGAAQSVSISDATPNSTIYYTLNGATPTTASAVYSGPIVISSNATVQAIALANNGSASPVASATYTFPAPAPTISPASGTYTGAQTVIIRDAAPNAAIYYTTDGSMPTTASLAWNGPITVSNNETITAIAIAANYSSSPPVASSYTIAPPPPTFSPAPGNYKGAQTVSLSDGIAGAAIYYTTNGSTPTASSTVYSAPISVAATESIQAIALSTGGLSSQIAAATYTINSQAGVPILSPPAGTYPSPQTVSIAEAVSGATVYYTVNGSMPNASSTVYSGPFSVSTNSTVQAIAMATGDTASPVASATYSFPASTPVISPSGGTYLAAQTVSMADSTPGAKIYYTKNGATPTSSSIAYTAPIAVSTNETIQAIALAAGYNSSGVAAATYTITPPAAAPTFSPAAGTYLKAESVVIRCATSGAAIHYTTDGSMPTLNSAVYSAPLSVTANETIHALALANGGSVSPISSASYIITIPAAAPTFSPAAGKYTTVQTVAIADATANAAIYYTTDGTTPTTSSNLYTGTIAVGATETIQAIGLAPGGAASPITKAAYTITLPTAVPVISPAGGTYNATQSVTITDATPNAVIHYTVNGSYPTTSSPIYTGQAITATANTTVQALALAPSDSVSSGAKQVYTIVAPAPTIGPGSGTYDYQAQITMTDTIPGATIYYTTNGTTPTTASQVYTGPIQYSPSQTGTITYQAAAIANGYLLSPVSAITVTVTLPAGVIANTVVGSTPALTIPPDFLGLSVDYTTPIAAMGQASTGANPIYRTLVNNLTQYMSAPLLMRVEGDNTVASQLQPAIEPLVEFAQAVNVNYTLGVDLMHDSPSIAETEAANWLSGVPNHLIRAFEIGNEPNAYPWQTLNGAAARPMSYSFNDYLSEYQEWHQDIETDTGSKIGSMGPSFSTSTWDSDAESTMLTGSDAVTIVSQHAYCDGPAAGQTLPSDYLLEPINATKLPRGYAPYAAAAHRAGLVFRMGEINSISDGGVAGISNTFSSALWALDIMFNYASNGMDGVNWHSGQGTVYQLFQFQVQAANGKNTYSLATLNPLYYSLLAFAQVGADGAKLLPLTTITNSNVSLWAIQDTSQIPHVIVINKDEAATGSIRITLPGYAKATVRYLKAPSITSQTGVTLAGQTFDGSVDGTIQGTLVTSTITGQNGVFLLPNMPVTTAAILDFSN